MIYVLWNLYNIKTTANISGCFKNQGLTVDAFRTLKWGKIRVNMLEFNLRFSNKLNSGVSVKKCLFIGTVENIYFEDNQKHHEVNLVFGIEVGKISDKSKEDHLEFFLLNIDEFSQKDVLPIALKKAVLKWLKDEKIFWASQNHDKFLVDDLD